MCGSGSSRLPYAFFSSMTFEQGPIPSAVRSPLFAVVISTVLSLVPAKYALTLRPPYVSSE